MYACVRVIAETIASLPLHVYETTDAGRRQRPYEHPLYRLCTTSQHRDDQLYLAGGHARHLLLWGGNAYSQIIRAGRSHILGLYPLLPDHMEVDRDSKGRLTLYLHHQEGGTVQLRPGGRAAHPRPGL